MMYSAPTLLVFFLTGVVVDRMDRQKVAYYSDFICGILSFGLIAAILFDWIPLVFLALFLRSAVAKFFAPAEISLIQGILTEEDYSTAAGLNQMVAGFFNLFATGLGLGAYWLFGVQGAIVGDAITFFVSAWLIRTCVIEEDARLPNGPHTFKDLNYTFIFADFKDGLSFSVMPIYILKYKLAPETYETWSVIVGIYLESL